MTQTHEQFDAIIIGVGQAGNPLATALSQAGWKTAVIERRFVGGTCVNDGCTPTKTMIASGRVAYLARRSADYGVHVDNVSVNLAEVRWAGPSLEWRLAHDFAPPAADDDEDDVQPRLLPGHDFEAVIAAPGV